MACSICFERTETLRLYCCDSLVCRSCLRYFLETSRDKYCFNREGNESHVIDFSPNEKSLHNIILQNICHEEKLILDSVTLKVTKVQELFSNYEEKSEEIMSRIEAVVDIHSLMTKISQNLPNNLKSPEYNDEDSISVDLKNIGDKGVLNITIFAQIKNLIRKLDKIESIRRDFFDLLDKFITTDEDYSKHFSITPDHSLNILVNKGILNDFIKLDFFKNPWEVYEELKDLDDELTTDVSRIMKELMSLDTSENFMFKVIKHLHESKDLNPYLICTIFTNFTSQNENRETSHVKFLCERDGCDGIMSVGTKMISCPRCHLEHCQNCTRSDCRDPGNCKKSENTFVLCPKCKTGISKVEGCDQMYCTQDNCGHKFDYKSLVSLENDPRFHNSHEPHSEKNVNENMFVYTNNFETDVQNLNSDELDIVYNSFSGMFPEDSQLCEIIMVNAEHDINNDILDFLSLVHSYFDQLEEYNYTILSMVDPVIIDVEKGIFSDFIPIQQLIYDVDQGTEKLTPVCLYKKRNSVKLDRDIFNILIRFICDFFVQNFPNIMTKFQKIIEDLDDHPDDILNDDEFNMLISNFMEKLKSRCFEISKRYEIEFERKTKLRSCILTSSETLFDRVLDGVDSFFDGLQLAQYKDDIPFVIQTNIR